MHIIILLCHDFSALNTKEINTVSTFLNLVGIVIEILGKVT